MKYFILIISCLLSQITYAQEQESNLKNEELNLRTIGCGASFCSQAIYTFNGIVVSKETFIESLETIDFFKDYEEQMNQTASREPSNPLKTPLINLYPNPASLSINIVKGELSYDRYGLYGLNGMLIKSNTMNHDLDVQNIDVSNLVPGNYFVLLSGPDGQASLQFNKH